MILGWLTLGILLGTFVMDLVTPWGFPAWAPYPIALMLAWHWRGRQGALVVAGSALVLILLGGLFSPPAEPLPRGLNRTFGIGLIVGLAWLVTYFTREMDVFHQVVEAAPYGTVIVDKRGAVRRVNARAEHLFGYTRAELIGQPIDTLVPSRLHDQHPPHRTAFLRAPRTGPTSNGNDLFGRHKDGHDIPVEIGSAPIKTARGFDVLYTIVDVTARKHAEETHARLAALVASSDDAIYSKSKGGVVMSWNAAAERLFGYSAAELVGQPAAVLVPPERMEEELNILERMEQGEHIAHFETLRRRKDGRDIVVSLTISPIEDGRGAVIGVSTIARDVTARARAAELLRESEARFRLMADQAPVIIWIRRADGACAYVNKQWSVLTGVAPEKALQSGWLESVHSDDRETAKAAFLATTIRREAYRLEYRLRRRDRVYRWVIESGTPYVGDTGEFSGFIGSVIDWTDIKEAEEALVSHNTRLEEQVAQRTQAVRQQQHQLRLMASELTITEQRERQRLATELHDYLAQLLVVCRLKLEVAKEAKTLPQLQALFQEMDGLLDEAMTYTRTLVADLSPRLLYELGLPAAVEWLGRQMNRHGLEVEIESEPSLQLAEDHAILLYQTVRELLWNVVKHAGSRTATVSLKRSSPGELELRVADQGRGFASKEHKAHEQPANKFGLLSIQARIKAMRGYFMIDSAHGKGTCVVIRVPLQLKDEMAPPAAPAWGAVPPVRPTGMATEQAECIRVVLVDDHAMVRQGLRSLLEAYRGVSVVGEAGDGQEAVELAQRLHPDVVVMDLNMPKLNGVQATRQITTRLPSIRVIGLSVADEQEVSPSLLEAGAVACLNKGRAPAQLYLAIRAACPKLQDS